MLLASWQICQWKWFSFLNYADTVVVVFSRRKVQLLISHNAHLQRVVCSNISHALWWLHHLLWNKISLLWPLTVFAEEEREADCMSCLRLCFFISSRAGIRAHAQLSTYICYNVYCLSMTLTRKSWCRQYYINILWEAHTSSPSSKMLLKQLV